MTKTSVSDRALATVTPPEHGGAPVQHAVDLKNIKIIKRVTRPLLKHADDTAVWIKPVSQIFTGKIIEKSAIKTPAQMIVVENLAANDGIEYQFIASHIIVNELTENYPDNSYVGKKFLIWKFPREEGKRFNTFSVVETE